MMRVPWDPWGRVADLPADAPVRRLKPSDLPRPPAVAARLAAAQGLAVAGWRR